MSVRSGKALIKLWVRFAQMATTARIYGFMLCDMAMYPLQLARGVPLEVVQANVGHMSIETTMRYLELQPEYVRKQSMKISSLYQQEEADNKSIE